MEKWSEEEHTDQNKDDVIDVLRLILFCIINTSGYQHVNSVSGHYAAKGEKEGDQNKVYSSFHVLIERHGEVQHVAGVPEDVDGQ